MDLGLKGRRALVTAASKGLGRACAQSLASEGASVFIASRKADAIKQAAGEIGAVAWQACDLSKDGEPQALVAEAAAKLGGLDVLVVNAGGPPPGTFQTTAMESWDGAYNLTLMSAVRLIHSALPFLIKSDQGRIVVITSISVRQPIANLALSNSLRGAVTGLAKTLSRELAPHGITVNCLAPDAILTDRIKSLAGGEEGVKQMAAHSPMGRLGDAADFGAVCAFLCSRQANYISGQTIGVDGASLVGVH